MESERINRHLALQLGISRREADELIEKGRVKINDALAKLGDRVSSSDIVTVNDKPVENDAQFVYLAFSKPVGYVCSRKAQGDAPTIYELLPAKYHVLKPVGRLDKNSSGLILLTNDGTFAHQMTHPSFHKTKVYEVELDQPLQPLHQQMISDFGVMLEDGKSKFMVERLTPARVARGGVAPASEEISDLSEEVADRATGPEGGNKRSEAVSDNEGEGMGATYRITMSEGRNRQIRRTFAALGYTVTRLHRTQFGTYTLGTLTSGDHRELQIAASSSLQSTE